MAAQHARQSHPTTGPKTETTKRFLCIFGAARQMPATRSQKGRKRVAVKRDQAACGSGRKLPERSLAVVGLLSHSGILPSRSAYSPSHRRTQSGAQNSSRLRTRRDMNIVARRYSPRIRPSNASPRLKVSRNLLGHNGLRAAEKLSEIPPNWGKAPVFRVHFATVPRRMTPVSFLQ